MALVKHTGRKSIIDESREIALELADRPEGATQAEILDATEYKTKRSIYTVILWPFVEAGKLRWVPYSIGKSGSPCRLYSTGDPAKAADYRRNNHETKTFTRDGQALPDNVAELIPDLLGVGVTARQIADAFNVSAAMIEGRVARGR